MFEMKSKHIQQIYIAFFGRPAHPKNIDYWLSSSNKKVGLQDIARNIFRENKYLISIKSNENVECQIKQLYLNLFNRETAVIICPD